MPPAMREVVDEFGRNRPCAANSHAYRSLAPSLTETLYALGVQDRLVGDTDYCDYPPDAQKKKKVGGVINPISRKLPLSTLTSFLSPRKSIASTRSAPSRRSAFPPMHRRS